MKNRVLAWFLCFVIIPIACVFILLSMHTFSLMNVEFMSWLTQGVLLVLVGTFLFNITFTVFGYVKVNASLAFQEWLKETDMTDEKDRHKSMFADMQWKRWMLLGFTQTALTTLSVYVLGLVINTFFLGFFIYAFYLLLLPKCFKLHLLGHHQQQYMIMQQKHLKSSHDIKQLDASDTFLYHLPFFTTRAPRAIYDMTLTKVYDLEIHKSVKGHLMTLENVSVQEALAYQLFRPKDSLRLSLQTKDDQEVLAILLSMQNDIILRSDQKNYTLERATRFSRNISVFENDQLIIKTSMIKRKGRSYLKTEISKEIEVELGLLISVAIIRGMLI